ncbi:AraC family transcriptional regulator [Acidaminobacter sp. JC074]|uniref:AraC family transcriptional regulator n=1 Tax=Acidaminobacter sp. JC074 TaxID=2530199 RepID=UPI001F103B88|nr:AraC family transcriptional regulator [Acidaminobacter sp. JC074]
MINIRLSGEAIEKQIKIYHAGYEDCKSGYAFGPFIRDHYLIHFVIKGTGIFKLDSEVYHIEKDQAFLIRPDQTTYYQADQNQPWSYYWVGFHGDYINDLLKETEFEKSPVIHFKKNDALYQILARLLALNPKLISHQIKQTSLLYDIFSRLSELKYSKHDTMSPEWYGEQAIMFMQKNYSLGVGIKEIAEYLNLDRSYFSRIFKQVYGVSAQAYLIDYRIEKAKYLLLKSDLKIVEVASSVGYKDAYTFSKAFKKQVGKTPTCFRQSMDLLEI